MTSAAVEVRGLSKRYGGVQALDAVTLAVGRGEIHALVGENGAGKSTLGKVVAGSVGPDAGEIRVDGVPVHYRTPREALGHGVAFVHQEISLVPTLTVLENVFLGAESRRAGVVRPAALRTRLSALGEQTGFRLNPDAIVARLPLAEQQKVEIVRALARDARLIVFDEPTAPLTLNECEHLYRVLRTLRERGKTIIYITHYLEEVLALADTVSVLKDGKHVATTAASEATVDSLILAMLGRSLESTFPPKQPPAPGAPVVLAVSSLHRAGRVHDVSLTARAGEIVGIAGLVGSGRTELARLLFGADRADRGIVTLAGERLHARSPREAIDRGIAYLPESRKAQGMLLARPVRENLTLPSLSAVARRGLVRRAREREWVDSVIAEVDVRPRDPERTIATLSGGNQQKVIVARELSRPIRLLIAAQPTRGLDVGSIEFIHGQLREQRQKGTAILLISAELDEILALADRIGVIYRGRLVATMPRADATRETLGLLMAGGGA